ncbi:reverse transcriptase [Penicillium alfredii]|uniref:Reverse transcriptase n=1 Tax=Penicillium alfredii TaxID=1506179 RepID=A0A9W9F0T6_9EURO|nr:reverse transcriptase [Penicillium alfredii]KAJ5091522.1 reverse transcriptase [Penicillium alfredii]
MDAAEPQATTSLETKDCGLDSESQHLSSDASRDVDASFTKALPKVELHAHLSGSISRKCLHEIWKRKKQQNPALQVEDPLVTMPLGKVDYTLQTFFQVFSKSIYQLCNDLESLAYATTSVLEDFFNDGVRYLELRTIPRASRESSITREEYIATVLDRIDKFHSKTNDMSVFLILALDRGNTTPTEALEIIDLAIHHKPRGVVGVDLCGNPTQGDVSIYQDAFAQAKAHGLGITLHFAETPASGEPRELATLLSFQPDRLGHVIHVPDEFKREISRRKLGLELCMSCNVHARMFDGGFLDHHFGYWRHEACPIALCTDDVGFFCSPVSHEYLLAAQHFDLSRDDLWDMSLKSVDVIFGGEHEKKRLRGLLEAFKSAALPQTLKSITATKIKELSKQRTLFDKRKDQILESAQAAPDLRAQVHVLLEGISQLKGFPKSTLDKDDMDLDDDDGSSSESDEPVATPGMGQLDHKDHTNIRRFLLQSRYDTSISETSLRDWIARLESEVRYLELKHEHAAFYSQLVTEWLAHLDEQSAKSAPDSAAETTDSSTSDSSFEKVGCAEHEQRATWESLVFTADTHADYENIRSYLDGLFNQTQMSRQALKELRGSLQKFGTEFAARGEWLDVDELRWVSQALMKTDLLSNEKTTILKEFMRSNEVAQEVADVLNMRLASLESWDWGEGASPLMLQYIGSMWAVKLRKAFERFLRSEAWSPLRQEISEEDRKRRKYFLGSSNPSPHNINALREETYRDQYFMSQLPESTSEGARSYDDESKGKSALDTKHSLLHLLITESIIHKSQWGEFTAVRSDFQWFGPSMSHTTMLTVLEYFGVPRVWLDFFDVFLEAPLKFAQDGPGASVRVRKRGLPMSHTLSDCFGESVLFCMDYAVNQSTNGALLYRLHDDFWFWGTEDTCSKAWAAMTKFANVVGLTFNEEKTGTVRMGKEENQKNSDLPVGDIRWGFLVLDAQQGKFVIDQAQVDQHIEELSRQLKSCKSVFSWVQAWNSYFGRFFTNNFATPAMCFGRDHIDMAVSTLSRIESALFNSTVSSTGRGITDHLRGVLADRFDIHNLPEGFFYYPVELGGLGLLNPFIRLLAMRENIKQTPQRQIHKAALEDEKQYRRAKDKFERLGPDTYSSPWNKPSGDSESFMSLEEYTKHAETYSGAFRTAYRALTTVPEERSVEQTSRFTKSQSELTGKLSDKSSISAVWSQMSPYWRWAAELYHDEMVRTYGSLAAVNREFMPLGVVKTLKEGRFRWQS